MDPKYDVLLARLREKDQIKVSDLVDILESAGFQKGIVATTDTVNTSVTIPVLSGGTSYIFTQPLTSLSIESVANVTAEDRLKFTLASGGSISWPAGCDVIPEDFSQEDGKSYKMSVVEGGIVIVPYRPGV